MKQDGQVARGRLQGVAQLRLGAGAEQVGQGGVLAQDDDEVDAVGGLRPGVGGTGGRGEPRITRITRIENQQT
ncbi:hypothetical protein B4Q13_19085, partial [Lacticaseibacillus rhamnosus]